MYIGSWKLEDLITFYANTRNFSSGNAQDADAVPSYHVYEDETGTPLITGTMALLNGNNTIGFYSEQITIASASGFEKGKSYSIYLQAVVAGVTGTAIRTFQIEAEVDANRINWANVDNPNTSVLLSGTFVRGLINPVNTQVTGTVNANLVQIDGLDTNGNNATLYLKQLNILNTTGDGITIATQGGRGVFVDAQDYPALELKSSADMALLIESIESYGVEIVSADVGLLIQSDTQDAIKAHVLGGNGNGINLIGAGTGKSIKASQGIQGDLFGNLYGNVTGTSGISTGSFINAIADQVWDEQLGGHLVTGSAGRRLNDAASTGSDPWATSIPASYTPGQAGYILGTNLNDTVSSRQPSGTVVVAGLNTVFLDTYVSSRLASGTFASNYVTPPTASQNAIATLAAAFLDPIDSNVKQINDTTITGDGSTTPWGPA